MADSGGDTSRWMIDSGTSTHMTPHRSVFVNFRQCVLPVSTATGDVFYTEGYGDVILKLLNQDRTDSLPSLTLKKVCLAPELKSSLISMSALDKDDIGTWTKSGFMTFKHQDQTFGGPESIVGFATYEGEHYWLNCTGIDKVNYMLDCNLVTGSPNSVFATKRGSPAAISVDLAHRRVCHASEDRVKKIEVHVDGVALKPGTGVTFPCTPYIKGKGHSLPFGCQCWFLIPKEKRATKLDPYIDEARLIAYDEGDNYMLYNVRTKKIVRSRNVIFNENPAPKDLPDPAYDLNITGID
ncbi:hypothetical protein N7530_010468 [Penicillium desertorum]|uniref:Uncharacterized protein n=1 Tax=Penicillium desertorum TaxID=1303715 RepID=A0A9X0BHS1_9EURO|nr:hypothetical protein N7530_010468 [Penicillium desertorum]